MVFSPATVQQVILVLCLLDKFTCLHKYTFTQHLETLLSCLSIIKVNHYALLIEKGCTLPDVKCIEKEQHGYTHLHCMGGNIRVNTKNLGEYVLCFNCNAKHSKHLLPC